MTEMNDINRRKRVHQLTEEIADLAKDAGERYLELTNEFHMEAHEIVELIKQHVPKDHMTTVASMAPLIGSRGYDTPMEAVIARLFAEAPKLEDASGRPVEGQAPALQCHIVLRPGHTIQGALSRTPEGVLRMLTPTEIQDPQTRRSKTVLAEQFFHVSDVVAVVLQRDVVASAGTRIHTS